MNVKVLITICALCTGVWSVSRAIPKKFLPCYRGNEGPRLPNTIRTFVELVRKAERSRGTGMDLRTMSYMLLHGFRLDGIEKAPSIPQTATVTPYRAVGIQYPKFKLLLERLVAAGPSQLDEGALTLWERCALHKMLSSTVEPWERGDEHITCPLSRTSTIDADVVNPRFQRQRINHFNQTFTQMGELPSRCPIEGGVVKTNWGDISPGPIIAAVASSLEPQNVRLADLITLDIVEDNHSNLELEDMEGKEKIRKFEEMYNARDTVNNVWAATLAGDLAEISVYQGPYVGNLLSFGPRGKWNDSFLPRDLYFPQSHGGKWEMTDAEILGGIDGLIIAQNLPSWRSTISSLRLSQILEMYYTERGMPLQGHSAACKREHMIQDAISRTELLRQTFAMSQALQFMTSTLYVEKDVMQTLASVASSRLMSYTETLINSLPGCSLERNGFGTSHPHVEMLLILDGTYNKYEVLRIISTLADGADISFFGSSLGVMHGRTGHLISNYSNSIAEIYANVHNYTGQWPQSLDLTTCLKELVFQSENQTSFERRERITGGQAKAVIVISQTARITSNDLRTSQMLLNGSLGSYPDLYFRYVTTDTEAFMQLSLDPLKTEQHINTDVRTPKELVKEIVTTLNNIPRRLSSPYCKDDATRNRGIRDQLEDYITPGEFVRYRIHPYYLRFTNEVGIQFQGSGYGDFTVCVARVEEYETDNCKTVQGMKDQRFNITNPCPNNSCPPVYITVSVMKTETRCAEIDCRFPDQVHYIIRHTGFRCERDSGSGGTTRAEIASFLMLIVIVFSCLYTELLLV